jgi:DNA-binding XRE family transcriptional regulator
MSIDTVCAIIRASVGVLAAQGQPRIIKGDEDVMGSELRRRILKLDHLYERRTARGWSQYDLADVSGVPQPTISRAENGLRVSRRTALLLAECLDTTPEALGGPDEPGLYVRFSDLTPEMLQTLTSK